VSVTTQFGCAYFGVRDPDHFEGDLIEIARSGFSWVLFPFTQDDAAWERPTFRLLVATAQECGLLPVIGPWGGDEFGGEGIQGRMATLEWLARARATGAPVLHVDEPRVATVTLPQVLDAWGDDASVWLTIQPERSAALDPETVQRVAVLGTDAYDGSVARRVAATRAFGRVTGRLDLAWVGAFRVPRGREAFVGRTVTAMAALAPYVGVWGWKGSTGRGELRSARPRVVQEHVRLAIADVRAGQTGVAVAAVAGSAA
jgi:hypothetical protein